MFAAAVPVVQTNLDESDYSMGHYPAEMERLVLQVMLNAYLCIEKEENLILFAVRQACQRFFEFDLVSCNLKWEW